MKLYLTHLKRIVEIEVLGVELLVWLNSANVCFGDIDHMKKKAVFLSRGFGLYLID
jgi:hypothetical protein